MVGTIPSGPHSTGPGSRRRGSPSAESTQGYAHPPRRLAVSRGRSPPATIGRQATARGPGSRGGAMTGQEVHVSWSGRHAIVTMHVEIDLDNSEDVDEQLKAVARQPPDLITADLTSTVFCDSAGVYVLTRVHELVAANGEELRLALGDSPVARIFELTGLDKLIPVYRDVQQSRDTPRAEPGPAPGG